MMPCMIHKMTILTTILPDHAKGGYPKVPSVQSSRDGQLQSFDASLRQELLAQMAKMESSKGFETASKD